MPEVIHARQRNIEFLVEDALHVLESEVAAGEEESFLCQSVHGGIVLERSGNRHGAVHQSCIAEIVAELRVKRVDLVDGLSPRLVGVTRCGFVRVEHHLIKRKVQNMEAAADDVRRADRCVAAHGNLPERRGIAERFFGNVNGVLRKDHRLQLVALVEGVGRNPVVVVGTVVGTAHFAVEVILVLLQ